MDSLTLVMGIVPLLVALFIVWRIVKVGLQVTGGVSFRDLRVVSSEAHERIGEYLRANHGGDPARLAEALRGLLPQVRAIAERHGAPLDDDVLRTLVVSSVVAHRAADRAQAQAAFDEAAGTDRSAA